MIVAGVDEVGRGSVAGPLLVVAAAFEVDTWKWDGDKNGANTENWLPRTPCPVPKVKDSKLYSSRRVREQAEALIIMEPSFRGRGRGAVSSIDITRYGMSWAWRRACEGALRTLPLVPDLVLMDGDVLIGWTGRQYARPKADRWWWPVSAASVLAKTERDRWMVALDQHYPGYGFTDNSGYGTPAHRHALRALGTTPVHRLHFVRSMLEGGSSNESSRAD